jgi:hypothetical protein
MLNGYAMINCSPELLENDRFNEHDERYLYCSINETQADSKRHYEANKIASIIKRETDDEGEIRGMNKSARSGKKLPLWNMNTNEADLHGIAYMQNDKALMSRLSITVWRKQSKTKDEMAEIDRRYKYNVNMPYSLYRYLTEEYDLTGYSPKRCGGDEKDAILALLRSKNKSPLQEFIEYLELADNDDVPARPEEVNYAIIRRYQCHSSRSDEKFEYILETEFKRELKKDKNLMMKADTLKTEMSALGWNYGFKWVKCKNVRCFHREYDEPVEPESDCV